MEIVSFDFARNLESALQENQILRISEIEELTKRAFESTLNLSLPPWHLGSLQPIWLLILKDVAAPIAAIREVLDASHSAILIC